MRPRPPVDRPGASDRDLASLADGRLAPARRARVERAVASSPELAAALDVQRRVRAAVRAAAGERAGAGLRARVELARPPRRARRHPAALVTAGSVAACAALALLVAGGERDPTVADAAVLATRPLTDAVPSPRVDRVTLPRLRAAGLPFPYWEDRFGWKAEGFRHDRLGGRGASTVFYRRGGVRIAYTIVGGASLGAGAKAVRTVRDGVVLRALAVRGRPVVAWLRRGHTCVLSGAPESVLLRLGAWRGGGAIPY